MLIFKSSLTKSHSTKRECKLSAHILSIVSIISFEGYLLKFKLYGHFIIYDVQEGFLLFFIPFNKCIIKKLSFFREFT